MSACVSVCDIVCVSACVCACVSASVRACVGECVSACVRGCVGACGRTGVQACVRERRGSLMVSTTACHTGVSAVRVPDASRTGNITLVGVKTLLSTLDTVSLCLSGETLKAIGPFYMVSGEVKDPTLVVNV